MNYITQAQINTAQAAIQAAQGKTIALDVYSLPYSNSQDPDSGTSGGYSLNGPVLQQTGKLFLINNPYTGDLTYIANANPAGSALVYLVSGTVLATK